MRSLHLEGTVTDDRLRIVCYKEIIYFYELSKLLHKDKADMMIN